MGELVLTTRASMVLFALWILGILVGEAEVAPAAQTGTTANGSAVRVTVKPDRAYVERSETGQHLNCDFLLENLTDEDLLLTGIELSVFGDGGRHARRDFINRFSRTSLEVPPCRILRGKQSTVVFNPFYSFASSVPLKRLRCEFVFATSDERVRHTSVTEVMPIVYETKRYGYDFVIVNEQGVMYRGAPKHSDDWYRGRPDDNEAYFAFGQPVYAAGAGRVVDVHDGEADNRRFDPTEFTKRPMAGRGNYVVIDHLNGEFSWFGHLKQGSVRVKRGQALKQGDILGLIGASGDSLFPHLHYELRTGPGITGVEGLPSYFGGFRRVGSQTLVARGQLDTGDVVENQGGRDSARRLTTRQSCAGPYETL